MEKPFFDVFPTLELNTELKNLFAVTKVTRVALTKARDFLKVYLFSEKLIQKKYIYQVEKAIRDQLFAGVQGLHPALELEPVSAEIQRMPDFFLGQGFQDLDLFVADLGAAVLKPFALPFPREFDHVFPFVESHVVIPLFLSRASSSAAVPAPASKPAAPRASPACCVLRGQIPLRLPAAWPRTPVFSLPLCGRRRNP